MTSGGAAANRRLKCRFPFFEQLAHLDFWLFIDTLLYLTSNLLASTGRRSASIRAVCCLYHSCICCLCLRISLTWKVISLRVSLITVDGCLSFTTWNRYLLPRKYMVCGSNPPQRSLNLP